VSKFLSFNGLPVACRFKILLQMQLSAESSGARTYDTLFATTEVMAALLFEFKDRGLPGNLVQMLVLDKCKMGKEMRAEV
jgi:hypothetical protein